MPLAPAVEGATHTAQEVTWLYDDGDPVNLTDATITGFKRNTRTGAVTALDGTFNITDAPNGVFTWAYGAGDVAAYGTYLVQFLATYGVGDVEKTQMEQWTVLPAIDDEVS